VKAVVSYVELLVALAIATVLAGLSVPLTAQTIDNGRARQGAAYLEGRFRMARQQAASEARSVGLVFDFDVVDEAWTIRVCRDGNGNGLRRADMAAGVDTCPGQPLAISGLFPGVHLAIDPLLPGPDGDPPSTSAVRFGTSGILSFSPDGDCTAGTLFIRSQGGAQYAIRVANMAGRMRLLHFNVGTRQWDAV
jgi:hypothetical protein